ncbi:hypothetical protein VC83_07524 [Pseudogymnoascus destructans]|uniref:HMG box domain-containing protein n=2 Tax=Pseudogymnoascus destructans TaxID=655981 RepID=L8G2Q3_PSED2|nr:uncharacterized protein VC83_07524 [Pseudogymnoascus destructans]ELR07412.1 hypothetical protein GMDG_02547 [Pseudogymnoascus destructans 20631-21]OAF56205.1 hypothetical protein VC83_07524 [Pseudogymnoascus destructans]
MARQRKADAEKPRDGPATLTIDVDSFVRTRDSVVTGLATLQDAIQTLSSAYIKHTNAYLGDNSGVGLEVESALSRLGDNPLLAGLSGFRAPTPAVAAPAADAKKEKKKRVHDPNAPKRPLTPYFLYMQTARPIIAGDLGPEVAKGAVSNEGVRRWRDMEDYDKSLWTGVYTENLRLYNARTHAYKSGILEAKDMTDDQARAYADTHNISTAPAEISANDQLNAESLLDLPAADAASLPSSPEAAAARATPKGKVRGKKVGGKVLTPAPEPAAIVPSSAAKAGSPDKKRKRLSKRGEETAVAGGEEDKGGKGRKKKARGE